MPDNNEPVAAEMPKYDQYGSTPAHQEPRLAIESALSLAIIEDAQDAIIAQSVDGTVLTWNASATRIFGYSAAEMIGGAITRLVAANSSASPKLRGM